MEEIDTFYAEKNCQEAISVSRILLATLYGGKESNWKELRNGACGAFFRAIRFCMNDLKPRLVSGGGISEAKELMHNLLQVNNFFLQMY